MSSQHSRQNRKNASARASSTPSLDKRIANLEGEIEGMREGIMSGLSRRALERARSDPEYLRYLRDIVELEDETERELKIAAENLRVAQDEMDEVRRRAEDIEHLRGRFQRGSIGPTDYVDAVDLLRRAVSPDAADVEDEEIGTEDESSDGEEEVGKKRKRKDKEKGKARAKGTPMPKRRKETEGPEGPEDAEDADMGERDSSPESAYETFLSSSTLLIFSQYAKNANEKAFHASCRRGSRRVSTAARCTPSAA